MNTNSTVCLTHELVLSDPQFFWVLLRLAQKNNHTSLIQELLDLDWSCTVNQNNPALVSFLEHCIQLDDAPLLSAICEALEPTENKNYFDAVRQYAQQYPNASKCYQWLANQGILGGSLEVFKNALWNGHIEQAKRLKTISATEAELIFFEAPQKLSKEAASLLLFIAPSCARHDALLHALDQGASDELCSFIAWKIEHHFSKPDLKYPDGNDQIVPEIFQKALTRGYSNLTRKLLDWNSELCFDSLAPDYICTPWNPTGIPTLKLDGQLRLTPLEWAFLFQMHSIYKTIKNAGAPGPDAPKMLSVIQVLAQRLDQQHPAQASAWLEVQKSNLAKLVQLFTV